MPLFLVPFISGAKSFLGFFLKPPGIYIAIGLGCILAIWLYGRHEYAAGVSSVVQKQAQQTVRLVVHEGQIITDLGFVYVPRFYAIQQEAQNHIAEIPQHVTPKIDADYPVPLGFVRVWNIDANGPVPAPAAGSDADPSGVKLSTVAVEHAIDTGTLETCRTALTEWWDWYDRNLKAWPK